MIFTVLINLAYGICQLVLMILPTVEDNILGIGTAISWFNDSLSGLNYFVPITDDIIIIGTLMFFLESSYFTIWAINYMVKLRKNVLF